MLSEEVKHGRFDSPQRTQNRTHDLLKRKGKLFIPMCHDCSMFSVHDASVHNLQQGVVQKDIDKLPNWAPRLQDDLHTLQLAPSHLLDRGLSRRMEHSGRVGRPPHVLAVRSGGTGGPRPATATDLKSAMAISGAVRVCDGRTGGCWDWPKLHCTGSWAGLRVAGRMGAQ